MNTISRRLLPAAALLALLLGLATPLQAQSVTYNFEQFGATTPTTPLLNVAPDIGSSSFRADFTSAPVANAFQVANFQPNGLFAGNTLYEPISTGNVLTVTLNTAVNTVSLVFALIGPGSLTFVSTAGTVSVLATAQAGGAGFSGGTLNFSSSSTFTSFTLATGAGSSAPLFAIDNLTMRTGSAAATPEGGSTLVLLGVALLAMFGVRQLMQRARA